MAANWQILRYPFFCLPFSMLPLPPGAITFGLHGSLVIPVATRSEESIEKYIGPVTTSLNGGEALTVSFRPREAPNNLPVWQLERSVLLAPAATALDLRRFKKVPGVLLVIFCRDKHR